MARIAAPLNSGEKDILAWLGQVYAGRATLTLDEFLRDFMAGRQGKPLKRKTALNQIYAQQFPVPVLNQRILLRDIAIWLYQERTKSMQVIDYLRR